MRFIWVDSGNDADWAKLAVHGMTGAFYAGVDPPVDVRRRLTETRSRGLQGGIYTAWNWFEAEGIAMSDGAAYAERTHELMLEIETGLAGKSPSFPKTQLDNEDHRPDVILAMLRRWRQLRPKGDTSWTFEAMQGGWMSPEFVAEVLSLRVRIVPQCYTGDMRRFESDVALRDLTRRGFPEAIVSPFLDARQLGLDWDGFAFTMGRLP